MNEAIDVKVEDITQQMDSEGPELEDLPPLDALLALISPEVDLGPSKSEQHQAGLLAGIFRAGRQNAAHTYRISWKGPRAIPSVNLPNGTTVASFTNGVACDGEGGILGSYDRTVNGGASGSEWSIVLFTKL
jgi:hypothetical protein